MSPKKILDFLAKHPPSKVAPATMSYFAAHLVAAPDAKVAEFFIHFEQGVRDALESARDNEKKRGGVQ